MATSSYLYTLIFTGLDGKVYRGQTYSNSTLQSWLSQCRKDGSPMIVATYETKTTAPRAWFMQTRTSDGTYTTRNWA